MDTSDVSELLDSWERVWVEVGALLAPHFARSEARAGALLYLRGLLSDAERKNSWQLAESVGASTPYAFQHLLGRAEWSAEALREELYRYVQRHLADPRGILVLDETGFLKKGCASAGVARQYSGTAGRVENCQVGVFLAYVSAQGTTLVDRALYLPQAWIADRARCAQAGIPADQPFATKPTLARQMIERVLSHGLPVAWVTGDSVYGDDRRLRLWLEEQNQPYVLALSGKEYLWQGWQQLRVSSLLQTLPTDGWQRLSAGAGAKGPRWYEWLRLPLGTALQEPGRRWLLVRRTLTDEPDLTAYAVFAPRDTPLSELVRVAGSRWAVATAFEMAKGEVGLDHYEVRSWTGWYRHITLALWALALLVRLRAVTRQEPQPAPEKKTRTRVPIGSLHTFKAQRGLSSP